LGSVTGIFGLIISFLNHKYNIPKIKIDRTNLIIPSQKWVESNFKNENAFDNRWLDFKLDIVVRNKSGGGGSIEKPRLIIIFSDSSKIFSLFKKQENLEFYPETKRCSSIGDTIDYGKSFNLSAGQSVDETLKYWVRGDSLKKIVKKYNILEYFIKYWDNRGKEHCFKINKIERILME